MSLLRTPVGLFGFRWIFAVSALAAFLLFPASAAQAVDPGDAAPLFNLMDQHGQPWSLSDQAGKVVLLFFFGHNAEVCTQSASRIQASLQDRYGDRGLLVLGIDCWGGTKEQVQRFADDSGVSFPLLLGGRDCAAEYGLSYHSFVLIDAHGTVRVVSAGPDASALDIQAMEHSVLLLLDEASAVTDQTWGRIKTLYGRKLILG